MSAHPPDPTARPSGPIRRAEGRHLLLILPVWVLSFPGVGGTIAQAHQSMRHVFPGFMAAIRAGRVLIVRGDRFAGLAFAWWEVDADRSWFVRYIAAYPRGRGLGDTLLAGLLELADQSGVVVRLRCQPGRVRWYRRHRFLPAPPEAHPHCGSCASTGLVGLRRPARTINRRRIPANRSR